MKDEINITLDDIDFFEDNTSEEKKETSEEAIEKVESTEEVEETEEVENEVEEKENEVPKEDADFYSATFDLYKEKGFFFLPEDYKFTPTEEGFEKALADSAEGFKESIFEELKAELPEKGLALLDYMRQGGEDIDQFIKVHTSPDYENVDLSSEVNQKMVVKTWLEKSTKWNEAKIDKHIQSLEITGDLETEAEEAKTGLAELSITEKAELSKNAQAQARARKEAEAKAVEALNTAIKSNKDINGYPISEKDSHLVSFLLKPIKLEDGTMTTAYNYKHAMLMRDPKFAILMAKLVNSNFDLTTLNNKKQTEVTKTVHTKLKEAMKHKGKVAAGQRGSDDELDDLFK